ncbi:MAG: hemolysin family protein [Candidatus Cloacimonetes bacterium]|nr:hemolysin family protein [Candidatus Cloacimonadota bacterium]
MDDSLPYLLLIVLLMLSAFFSGSETAFFSLTKIQLKKYEKKKQASYRRISHLLSNPRSLLILILLGNTLVNVTASSTAAVIALKFGERYLGKSAHGFVIFFEIVLMTFLLLIFGEITPKLIAFNSAETFSRKASLPLLILSYMLFPLLKILEIINNLFSSPGQLNESSNITPEDLRNLLNSKNTDHPLEDSEKEIIKSIFRFFSGTKAREIMTPRVDMVAIEENESLAELRKCFLDSGHSKIPVYKKNIDNIIGFVYAKDVILDTEINSIRSLLRQSNYVTENSQISTILNLFRRRKLQIALVVDEYGGTSGLLTMEDIMEEIVGEILDEYDKEGPTISKLSEAEYIISGMVTISELNQKFDLDIPEDEYDNLAEYLYDSFNRVPVPLDSFIYDNRIKFVVTNIKSRRINYVRLEILSTENNQI